MNIRKVYALIGLVALTGLFLISKPNEGVDGAIYVAYLIFAAIALVFMLVEKTRKNALLRGLEAIACLLWVTTFVRAIIVATKITAEPEPVSIWLAAAFVFSLFLPPGVLAHDFTGELEK